jgi:hypothetical protein
MPHHGCASLHTWAASLEQKTHATRPFVAWRRPKLVSGLVGELVFEFTNSPIYQPTN